MNDDKKAILKKYLACFCVGVAITLFILALKGFSMEIGVLCDAFTTAGLLLILVAGLMFVSGEGVFLGIGYALGRAVRVFIPTVGRKEESYAKYRERKMEKPKPKGQGCIFFTGLFFFAIAIIFLIIWYQQ